MNDSSDRREIMQAPASNNTPMLFSSDPAAIAAAEQARMQIQMAYFMAVQSPRDFMAARAAVIDACKRPEFAERAIYSKPVGGQRIEGPSVRFAEQALRAWRNTLTMTSVIYEDTEKRRVKVSCIDIETNTQFSKEIVVNKTVERRSKKDREVVGERQNSGGETVYIVKATDDELQNKEASAISKAVRNEGLRLIPSDIVDEALAVARQTMANGDARDPFAKAKAIADLFRSVGVSAADLVAYLGHPIEAIRADELPVLRGIYTAIQSGEARWFDYVSPEADAAKSAAFREDMAAVREKMRGHAAAAKPSAVPPSAGASQDAAAAPIVTPEDLAHKVRTCAAVPHLENIRKKYRAAADNDGWLAEFEALCDERKAELRGDPPAPVASGDNGDGQEGGE